MTLLKEAVELVATLHSLGYVHMDLKWDNFLWVPNADQPIVLTDLDHLRRSYSAKEHGKDFARFILSAIQFQMGSEVAESLTNCYLDNRTEDHSDIKRGLFKRIQKKRRKYEKRLRSSEPTPTPSAERRPPS